MNTWRLYLVILTLAIGSRQVCLGQNKPVVPPANGTPTKAQIDPQLAVNRDALLGGSLPAAEVLLFNEDPNAREILLDVLGQSENSPARIAICQSLINAKAGGNTVKDIQSFIEPLLGVFATEVADEARLARDATLIFEYEQVREPFEKLLGDASKPVEVRVNVVRALKLRKSDMAATIKLITLVDSSDKQISAEARRALESLGVEVGENANARGEIIRGIIEQGRVSFLQNSLIREAGEGHIVNTASRIEGLNKHLGTRILVSREVVDGLDGFLTRDLGEFILPGKSKPVAIYELICSREEAGEQQERLCSIFQEVLDAYRNQAWDDGIRMLSDLLKMNGGDGPSRFYLELCKECSEKPSMDVWDGMVRVGKK